MPDVDVSMPRESVNFSHANLHIETYLLDDTLEYNMRPSGDENNNNTWKPGVAVAVVANDTAGLSSGGDRLLGMFRTPDKDLFVGGIQEHGYARFEYNDDGENPVPVIGDSVEVDGEGKVQVRDTDDMNMVVSVDTDNKWVWVKMG